MCIVLQIHCLKTLYNILNYGADKRKVGLIFTIFILIVLDSKIRCFGLIILFFNFL